MSFAKAYSGLRSAGVRALVIVTCGATLAGCDTLSSLNPFDKGEVYKPEIVSVVPGETLYNDGLARIQKQDYEGAAKKFSSLEKQNPYSEWSRKALIMTRLEASGPITAGSKKQTPMRRQVGAHLYLACE